MYGKYHILDGEKPHAETQKQCWAAVSKFAVLYTVCISDSC